MNRYLIEVSHDPSHQQCMRLAGSMTQAGAHYVERAEWGCEAGIHSGWLIAEALDDADARMIVPPSLRRQARVVRLNRLSIEELRAMQPGGLELELQAAVA